MTKQKFYQYLPDHISFKSKEAAKIQGIYFPLCSPEATGLKSAITPYLSGDIKIDKYRYVTKPVSREDLRHPVRNFFLRFKDGSIFSLAQPRQDNDRVWVEMGPLWHKVHYDLLKSALSLEVLNFIPSSGEPVELMEVSIKNNSSQEISFSPFAAIPIFARALANKHDHEHVTALLHRIEQIDEGVVVSPVMRFNEEGHKENHQVYFVLGFCSLKSAQLGSFPTVDSFLGDEGTLLTVQAVKNNLRPKRLDPSMLNGKEAFGALRFKDHVLKPQEEISYFLFIGSAANKEVMLTTFNKFSSKIAFDKALKENQQYWFDKAHAISFHLGDPEVNSWLQWSSLQPVFRRIFGCSFLPDHDYGKGGKGWRDIWQDLLSLILIEPHLVRDRLVNNFAGVRIDGTNATIIGSLSGEFVADRNAISRVWMDHGVWPCLTTFLYIHQTGDFDILLEPVSYFRDPQQSRTFSKDLSWNEEYGQKLKDQQGCVYRGTILEHILVQNLVQFFNVGEHNLIRLESADWNDGLDMAFKRGESVAFSSIYAGNLFAIAQMLENLNQHKRIEKVEVAQELLVLLDSLSEKKFNYDSVEYKKEILFKKYFPSVQPEVSGQQAIVDLVDLVQDLRQKAQWLTTHIRQQDKIKVKSEGKVFSWFNGYYDNQGRRVEGQKEGNVWMTLTGQVFPVMSGVATSADIVGVIASVNHFLKDSVLGGIRLNTDFGLPHYLDLGRAFGFAYGTKENGAFFSHMTVMYAYGLYLKGFAQAGFEVLRSIYAMCSDPKRSKIYPGIPEYFDSTGKGMYHYLTGSASWLVLTVLTQCFGVRGQCGDLVLNPKLVKEEFDLNQEARVSCQFAGKKIDVVYQNPKALDFGQYKIHQVFINEKPIRVSKKGAEVVLARELIAQSTQYVHIRVILG